MFDLPTTSAVVLITAGLLVKAAIFPLHVWLPPAHASAPAPVSAALSALVVKGALYLLLRSWLFVFPAPPAGLAQLLAALGAAAALYGSIQALHQKRLKGLVAYSTVAQLGYALLVLPLWSAAAWTATLLHLAAHGLAKAALFMAAGNVLHALGHDTIDALTGLGRRLNVSLLAFGAAGISLAGLPPSGGFLAKWYFVSAALEAGSWWWASIVVLGGLLAAAYVARVLRPALMTAPQDPVTIHRSVSATMAYVPLALALSALAFGFLGPPFEALVRIGGPGWSQAVGP